MRHRMLGRSGLRVSQLCLGTLTFGEPKHWGADPKTAFAILTRFTEAGGTFIDTAPNYSDGVAEEIVGRFADGRRDELVIATKYTASARMHPLAGGNGRKSMMRSVEASLRRLRTDYVDMLWLHYWDATTPLDEILRGFDDLVRAGKVLHVGLSDTPAWLISRAATIADWRGWSPVVATQVEYNVAARSAERELLPMAEALDLGVVCWGAFAAGALHDATDPQRRTRSAIPKEVAGVTSALRALAVEVEKTPSALALAWLSRRRNCVPLIGARTVDQIDATIVALDTVVPDSALDQVDALSTLVPEFPHALIASPYLRKLAMGNPATIDPPVRPRC